MTGPIRIGKNSVMAPFGKDQGRRYQVATANKQDQVRGTVVRMANGQFVINREADDPQLSRIIKAQRKKLTASPEASRKFLQQAGILTPTGRLAKRFGG